MKIGDIACKFRLCSSGEIHIHIYDRGSRKSEDLYLTPAEMNRRYQAGSTKAYPFNATLESIDYIQGMLTINGSIRG